MYIVMMECVSIMTSEMVMTCVSRWDDPYGPVIAGIVIIVILTVQLIYKWAEWSR